MKFAFAVGVVLGFVLVMNIGKPACSARAPTMEIQK